MNVEILQISADTVPSLKAWAEQLGGIPFPLLSDYWPHGAVSTAYGVFNDTLGAAERGTFVIDKQGIVRWTVRNEIPNARDVADYQKALAEL